MYDIFLRLSTLVLFGMSTALASIMFLDFLGHFGWSNWGILQLMLFVSLVLSAVGTFLALMWDVA